MLSHLSPAFIFIEVANVALFAVDFGFYIEMAGGGDPAIVAPSVLLSALALFASTGALVKALRGRAHERAAAVGSFVLWGYVVFVALVYQQTPSANYGPLVHLFPLLFASALGTFSTALASRWPSVESRASAWRKGLLVVLIMGLALTMHWPRAAIRTLAPRVLSEMAQHIRAFARPGDAATLTLTYNQAGVFDALASLPQPTLAAHRLFAEYDRQDTQTLLDARMRLVACGEATRLVVLAREFALVDEAVARRLPDALERTARQCGATLRVVASVPGDGALLDLIRVVPPR